MGDILIVTITKKFIEKIILKIFFDDQIRLKNLADIDIGIMALSPYDYAYEIIKIVKSNFYLQRS